MIWQLLVCSVSIATNTIIAETNHFTMNTISVTYRLKWRLKTDHKYQWSECGKLFNVSRGTMKKKVVNGSSIGYWIGTKFYTLAHLRQQLELIPKEKHLI